MVLRRNYWGSLGVEACSAVLRASKLGDEVIELTIAHLRIESHEPREVSLLKATLAREDLGEASN